jgi:heptosyltransferase I
MTRESFLWVRGFTGRYCAFASRSRQFGEAVPPPDQQPRKICILRLSALGDATHVVPVVRSIQNAWPESQISWIIGKLEHRLVSGLEKVEFIEFDKRGGWTAVEQLRRQLMDRRFDILLHMQVAARANLLSKMVRAPVRLGWDRARSRDLHHHFVRQQVRSVPFQHQVQGFLEFPRALGIEVVEPRWEIPIDPEATQWAESQLGTDDRTLIISPCSSHPLRNWSSENYAEVADYAQTELGLQVVLSGGPSELEQATGAAIEAQMQGSCLNLVGKDTLEQSKALLKRADLVISPDSGPAHIASALGTPVIGLYAATWSRRSGPYNSLELCIDRFEQAARQFRNKSPEELRWGTRIEEPGVMDLVTVENVIEKLNSWSQ